MAVVRAHHTLHDLAADLAQIANRPTRDGSRVVHQHVRQGRTLARRYARSRSGLHGLNYYKRITDEMIGPLEGEYGPTGDVGRAVGAGWRNGPGNTDIPRSADVVVPKYHAAVARMVDDWFWS